MLQNYSASGPKLRELTIGHCGSVTAQHLPAGNSPGEATGGSSTGRNTRGTAMPETQQAQTAEGQAVQTGQEQQTESTGISVLAGKTFKSTASDGTTVVERYDDKGVLIENKKPEEAGKVKDDSGKGENSEPPAKDPEDKGKADGKEADPDDEDNLIVPGDPKGVQTRIGKALKAKREAETKAARLEGELAGLRERLAALESGGKKADEAGKQAETPARETQTGAPVKPVRPNRDNFEDYESYEEALDKWRDEDMPAYFERVADWKAKQELNAYIAQQEEAAAEARQRKWVSEGTAKHEDFEAVAMAEKTIALYSDDMLAAVNASENSHELAYHLGKTPAELKRIAALNPYQQVREIVRIDLELQGKQKQQKQETSENNAPEKKGEKPDASGLKRTTDAEPPIKPLGGAGSAAPFDPLKASASELKRHLDAQAIGRLRQG